MIAFLPPSNITLCLHSASEPVRATSVNIKMIDTSLYLLTIEAFTFEGEILQGERLLHLFRYHDKQQSMVHKIRNVFYTSHHALQTQLLVSSNSFKLQNTSQRSLTAGVNLQPHCQLLRRPKRCYQACQVLQVHSECSVAFSCSVPWP